MFSNPVQGLGILVFHISRDHAYNEIDVNVNCGPAGLGAMTTYTIAELAHEFGITPRTIRFYEDQGLIAPRREGSNGRVRVYTSRERTRLKLALRGKRLGLALAEIKELIDLYDSRTGSTTQLKRFLAILTKHRAMLEQQLEDIKVTLEEISGHESICRRLLTGETVPGTRKTVRSSISPASVPPKSRL